MANLTEVKRKLCIIGDGGVGKTSLIRRFVFDQFDDKYLATFGTKVTKKSVDLEKSEDKFRLNLLIWDVMGQEEFKKAQSYAYNGTHGAFVVCDITRHETFANIESWRKDIFKVTKKIPIVILANKYDLTDDAEVTEDDLNELSKQLDAPFFYTSAKTGENVEKAFMEIGNNLV